MTKQLFWFDSSMFSFIQGDLALRESTTQSRKREPSKVHNIVESTGGKGNLNSMSLEVEQLTTCFVSKSEDTEISVADRNNQASLHVQNPNSVDSNDVLIEHDREQVNASIIDHCYTEKTVNSVHKVSRKEEELEQSFSRFHTASIVSNEPEPEHNLMLHVVNLEIQHGELSPAEFRGSEIIFPIVEPQQKLIQDSSGIESIKVSNCKSHTVADESQAMYQGELMQAVSRTNSKNAAFEACNNAENQKVQESMEVIFCEVDDQDSGLSLYNDPQSNSFSDIFNEQNSLEKSYSFDQVDNEFNSMVSKDFNIADSCSTSSDTAITRIGFTLNELHENNKSNEHNLNLRPSSKELPRTPPHKNTQCTVEKKGKCPSNSDLNGISENDTIQGSETENNFPVIESDISNYAGIEDISNNNFRSLTAVTNKPVMCNAALKASQSMQHTLKPKYSMFDQTIAYQKQLFECVCGSRTIDSIIEEKQKSREYKHQVQCSKCGVWQHAECLNFDLQDPYRGEYMCPHCHVQSVSIILIMCYMLNTP